MSDTLPGSLLHKLRHTPLRDIIRGRCTGRLDLKGRIAASALPAPAKELVARVVRRTRLWSLEKAEVADELLAHFADGLESGTTLDDLTGAFGNERQAARLIRRAKKRNRPLLWHVLRVGAWLTAGLFALYAILAVPYLFSHPTPRVDYVAQINRARLQVPVEQRAWPIYRRAILALGDFESNEASERLNKFLYARSRDKRWPDLIRWVDEHAQAVALARQASAKPRLGFILGPGGSADDPDLFPKHSWAAEAPLNSILLPQLNGLKHLGSVVWADARVAQQQGDGARFVRDIETLLHLAEQLHHDNDFLIADLVAMGISAMALEAADSAVADQQHRLGDADLQRLAHRLSGPKVAADLFSFAVERLNFHDVIQRAYTDDGHGDGHLTFEGQQFVYLACACDGGNTHVPTGGLYALQWALAPALAAPRREVLERYDSLMDIADANLRLPAREANWSAYEQRLHAWRASGLSQIRLGPLAMLPPGSLGGVQQRAERHLGRRDGIVVGIALELYRRRHGEYPATLAALAPQYLPAIPADRITGEPVRYRLVSGRPLIYSVGADRKDDGGKPAASRSGRPEPLRAADFTVGADQAVSGDWVLYPQPEPEPEGDEAE